MARRRIGFLSLGRMATAVAWIAMSHAATDLFPVQGRIAALLAADEKPGAEEKSKQRLEYMFNAIKKYRVEVGDSEPVVSELHDKPLLRWTNPVSDTQDAIAAAFTRGGRPDVLLQFHIVRPDFVIHEFSKIATAPLTMKRGSNVTWKPAQTWIQFQNLPDAPAPAKTAVLRVAQMRKQAERFVVTDEFEANGALTKHHLRLLSQPIFRYHDDEGKGDIVDGAVFSFALGTDPEANLLIEVHQEGDKQAWRYALAPMSIYTLEGTLDDAVVWTKPVYKDFCNGAGGYYVCPFIADQGEKGLTELLR